MRSSCFPVISPPSYLPEAMLPRFDDLSKVCVEMGTLTALDVDVLAKYLIAENEYLRITNKVTAALNAGDSSSADRWISAQVRIQRESIALAGELGLTSAARRSRGIPYPGG